MAGKPTAGPEHLRGTPYYLMIPVANVKNIAELIPVLNDRLIYIIVVIRKSQQNLNERSTGNATDHLKRNNGSARHNGLRHSWHRLNEF